MTKTKRAVVAAACAAGAAAGLLSMSGPAFASGSATATYNCHYVDPVTGNTVFINGVTTTWQHGATNNLTIKANISSPVTVPAHGAYATVNSVQVWNAVPLGPAPLIFGPTVVPGSISAPNPLVLHIVGPPAVDVTCDLVSSSGFPI